MLKHIVVLAAFVALTWATPSPKVDSKSDDTLCTVCMTVMTAFDDAITNPDNEQEVIDFVLSLCPVLMPGNTEECLYMISTYGDDLIHFITDSGLSPDDICSSLHACP
eukprot:maker-scaffold370_size193435-snap-gene-0.30 protein:Tk07793 transcript:maker-scaffold370_size193435-snap-gene-0.30-mRNA-1 annotation:"hypothetical protein SINV_15287"